MTIQRVFIDWNRPALAAAAGYLFSRAPDGDLASILAVVPGQRAGERLLELLIDEAERRGVGLTPPRILTAGELPEQLYEPKRPFADKFTQHLAWIHAIRLAPPARVARLLREPPPEDDQAAWLALGEMFCQLHTELAGSGLDFSNVVDRGSALAGFSESLRWRALHEVQTTYHETLDSLELWDRQTARLVALKFNECQTDRDIVLIGMVDLNTTIRAMLDCVADRVTALIFAPPGSSGMFDEHGCLRIEDWVEMPIPVRREWVSIVADPADQAKAAVRCLAALEGRFSAEEIVIGAADESIVPQLQQVLDECGLPNRYGLGQPMTRTEPYLLLEAIATSLESGRFSDLAALARHPAVSRWLARTLGRLDFLDDFDHYHTNHLPGELREAVQRGFPEAAAKVRGLAAALGGPKRPLSDWAESVAGLLVELFGDRELILAEEADRLVLAACETIRSVLLQQAAIPPLLLPAVTGAEAVRLLLRAVGTETIGARQKPGAIELLGWLELPLDDAPVLIVTGFNEGIVPSSQNGDLFLPNELRRQLQVEDNDRRYARDAYATCLLAASRTELRIIAGRRSSRKEPLIPSRLLFAGPDDELAERTRTFFSRAPAAAPLLLPHGLQPGANPRGFSPVPPPPLVEVVPSLRVTEFRDYLKCPYRYYLKHRLKLSSLDDSQEELDAAQFGTLLHLVLNEFSQDGGGTITDVEEIERQLSRLLDRAVLKSFGKHPLPAVRLQAEQARLRLYSFARWQAGWAAQGWEIWKTEYEIDDAAGVTLSVDGEPMILHGKIDRIDLNRRENRWIVFDYKTGESGLAPDKTHRAGDEWIDLQLPLYRHLVRSLVLPPEITGPVELGYIVLPKATESTKDCLAEWTPEDLFEADRIAEKVIRGIRGYQFWQPAAGQPDTDDIFAAICGNRRFAVAASEGDEGEGDEA